MGAPLRKELGALSGEHKLAEEAATASKTKLATLRKTRETELNELAKGILSYQRLGLSFVRLGDDKLQLVFSMIDPADIGREFSFSVHVNEENSFEVNDVDPPVEGLLPIVKELYDRNNFSEFVKAMRRKFK